MDGGGGGGSSWKPEDDMPFLVTGSLSTLAAEGEERTLAADVRGQMLTCEA